MILPLKTLLNLLSFLLDNVSAYAFPLNIKLGLSLFLPCQVLLYVPVPVLPDVLDTFLILLFHCPNYTSIPFPLLYLEPYQLHISGRPYPSRSKIPLDSWLLLRGILSCSYMFFLKRIPDKSRYL